MNMMSCTNDDSQFIKVSNVFNWVLQSILNLKSVSTLGVPVQQVVCDNAAGDILYK